MYILPNKLPNLGFYAFQGHYSLKTNIVMEDPNTKGVDSLEQQEEPLCDCRDYNDAEFSYGIEFRGTKSSSC